MNKRLILVGKAGSGKDFFRDYCNSHWLDVDVSYTTRPPRTGETQGYTYNFIKDTEFQNLLLGGNLHEYVEFNGWSYATGRLSWERSQVFIMTPSGIKQISRDDRKYCIIIYFDIPIEVRKERLELRSDADSVSRRLASDEKDFENFGDFDIKISNPGYDPGCILKLANTYDRCDT